MSVEVRVTVNGVERTASVPDRLTLADLLRDRLGLTGTRLGCEQGVCGACTVLLDGSSVRACLVLAAQADGCDVRTVEGLSGSGEPMSELQSAFDRNDAFQCGFCTPGMLMTSAELLARPTLDEAEVRSALSGNLCRCTGYEGIVAAVLEVHRNNLAAARAPLGRTTPLLRSGERSQRTEHAERNERTEHARPGRSRSRVLAALAGAAVAVVVLIARRRGRDRLRRGGHGAAGFRN